MIRKDVSTSIGGGTGFRARSCASDNKSMDAPERPSRPQAVLFACGMNAVRSPMAAALLQQMVGKQLYVASAGVQKGEARCFRGRRHGGNRHRHRPPQADHLRGVGRSEGLNFDLVVTLSPPAHHRALELTRSRRGRGRILADRSIRRATKAAASSGSTPTAKCAISCWRASASVWRRGARQ